MSTRNPYLEQSYTGRQETRELVDEVVESAFQSVCSTMGPNANLALIIEKNQPVVTKDGLRVAKALDFNEIRKNNIAELITSAAETTDRMVGDGTTTTVFMVNGLYNKFKDDLDFNSSRQIDSLIGLTKKKLGEMVTTVTADDEEFRRMVYTTSNYQADIADKVIEVFSQYKSPKVLLKRGGGRAEDVIEVHSDITFDGRYATPHLTPPTPRGDFSFNQAAVMLLDGQINTINKAQAKEIVDSILESKIPLFIVARSFEPAVTDILAAINEHVNTAIGIARDQQRIFVQPYTLNAGGKAGTSIFKDLGQLMGANVYTGLPEAGNISPVFSVPVEDIHFNNVGIHFDLNKPIIKERANKILEMLEPNFEAMNVTVRASVLGKLLQNRIGRLRAENVTIYVSGMTDAEISERYYLYEDACRVAETSLRYGVIPGVGYGFNQVGEHIYETIINPLKNENIDGDNEKMKMLETSVKFCEVLFSQYEYLVGNKYVVSGDNKYHDLVRDEIFDRPEFVFDNGCAAMAAIEGAWSVVKRLIKLSAILGKSNHSYQV